MTSHVKQILDAPERYNGQQIAVVGWLVALNPDNILLCYTSLDADKGQGVRLISHNDLFEYLIVDQGFSPIGGRYLLFDYVMVCGAYAYSPCDLSPCSLAVAKIERLPRPDICDRKMM